MIVTRSPLRISLGGGGTDLPSYYELHGGFLIAAAINKYVYVTVMRPFVEGIFLKYSQIEEVKQINDVRHPIIREALDLVGFKTPQIEITSLADIPSGTGLGSSGSFATGLVKALYAHRQRPIHQKELAELACHIELERLKEPIGKQDQFISAIGGITCIDIQRDGAVTCTAVDLSMETKFELEDNLLLFFTGFSRSASVILKDQNTKTLEKNAEMIENLHVIKEIGLDSKKALEDGDLRRFGLLMHKHWQHKKNRTQGMSNSRIDQWYQLGKDNGAYGGKIVGAGGGGFLMFMAEDRNKLRAAMYNAGLEEVRFKFDFEGTKVMLTS